MGSTKIQLILCTVFIMPILIVAIQETEEIGKIPNFFKKLSNNVVESHSVDNNKSNDDEVIISERLCCFGGSNKKNKHQNDAGSVPSTPTRIDRRREQQKQKYTQSYPNGPPQVGNALWNRFDQEDQYQPSNKSPGKKKKSSKRGLNWPNQRKGFGWFRFRAM